MSTLPTIHLNGTSAGMLLEGYLAANLAVDEARSALAAVEFNARDYYVARPDAWKSARTAREVHFAALDALQADLMAHVLRAQRRDRGIIGESLSDPTSDRSPDSPKLCQKPKTESGEII